MADTARLRVLIADDHALMATALERVVSLDSDVVGRLTDGSSLLAETKRLQPDILLLDLHLPNINSLSACEEIRRIIPCTRVIILTGGLNPNLRPIQGQVPGHLRLVNRPLLHGDGETPAPELGRRDRLVIDEAKHHVKESPCRDRGREKLKRQPGAARS